MENIPKECDEKTTTEPAMQIINYIQTLIYNGYVPGALEHINELLKLLMSEVNHDKIIYIIAKFLNKIMATTSPKLRDNACLTFAGNLEKGINNINFEKQVLSELQTYVNNCKKTKNYNNLLWALSIIYFLMLMQENQKAKISIDAQIYQNEIKGIKYIPAAPINDETEKYRENIEKTLQRI